MRYETIPFCLGNFNGQKSVLVSAHPTPEIRRKLPRTETGITLPPKQVHRSPRWHMKYKWQTYLFVLYFYFHMKSCLSAGGGVSRGEINVFQIPVKGFLHWQTIMVTLLLVLCDNCKLIYMLEWQFLL